MRVIGCTTRRPCSRHHRKRPAFRVGTRIPVPRNASAFAISAWISAFFAHYLANDGPKAYAPLVLLLLLAISYWTRPASRQWPPKTATE